MARRALYVLIVSVSLSALLGVGALLSGDFGDLEVRVLLSTLSVSGASILAMASAAAWERQSGRPWAAVGIGASIAGFSLVLIGIWLEPRGDFLWKLAASLITAGCAGAHGALLRLARLAPAHRWLVMATLVIAALLALVVVVEILTKGDGEGLWRLVGVLAILATTGSLVTAILQRLDRREMEPVASVVHCPHCDGELSAGFLAKAVKRRER